MLNTIHYKDGCTTIHSVMNVHLPEFVDAYIFTGTYVAHTTHVQAVQGLTN